MRRRGFLQLAMTGAATAVVLPGWLRAAFADVSLVDGQPIGQTLADAVGRARRLGKPLLVVIVPVAAEERWERGTAWGELLNHGTDAQLAPLALAEVACAPLDEVHALLPRPSVTGKGTPLLVVVDSKQGWQVNLDVPHLFSALDGGQRDGMALPPKRMALLAGAVGEALLQGDPTAGRWSTLVRPRLTDGDIDALEAGRWDDLALVDRGAALVWTARTPASEKVLARAAAARLRDLPPAGSRWGHATGCGTTYEKTHDELAAEKAADAGDEECRREPMRCKVEREKQRLLRRVQLTALCGMGHVPAQSARFLDFLTRKKQETAR